MKVTRIAYSAVLNPGKYAALVEQARRLGHVRAGLQPDHHGRAESETSKLLSSEQ